MFIRLMACVCGMLVGVIPVAAQTAAGLFKEAADKYESARQAYGKGAEQGDLVVAGVFFEPPGSGSISKVSLLPPGVVMLAMTLPS